MGDIYTSIADELRMQYSLGFTPDKDAAGEGYHRVVLQVKKKDMAVQTREGYYGGVAEASAKPRRERCEKPKPSTTETGLAAGKATGQPAPLPVISRGWFVERRSISLPPTSDRKRQSPSGLRFR